MPEGSEANPRPDGKGGYLVTLAQGVFHRLAELRGRGGSYSDVIVRLANIRELTEQR